MAASLRRSADALHHTSVSTGHGTEGRFRAWFGADPKKHPEQQVRENIGKLGTLIISVNGKDIPIDL
jgi:hypothetical protein